MFTRRMAMAAVLLALVGAACGGGGGAKVATGDEPAPVVPAAAVVESTTAPTTAPPASEPPEAAAEPVVNAAPGPATIEVDYQPQDGASASATISGEIGTHSKPLDGGAALFSGIPAGTYSVTITVDTPSGNPAIGDARTIINGGEISLSPGEHGVLTCDDNGCG